MKMQSYDDLFRAFLGKRRKAKLAVFLMTIEKGKKRNRQNSEREERFKKSAHAIGYEKVEFLRIKRWRYGGEIPSDIFRLGKYVEAFRSQKEKYGIQVDATFVLEDPELFEQHVPSPIRQSLESWVQLASINDVLCEDARRPHEASQQNTVFENWELWMNK